VKKELQDKLFEKYPRIFKQKDLSSNETCMCWGITCGDGWYDIIDTLCESIQQRVQFINGQRILVKSTLVPTKSLMLTCEAGQIKEKFGGLRFYIDGGDDFINGLISMAESISYKTCEMCGSKGKPEGKWIKTLCEKCRKNRFKNNS